MEIFDVLQNLGIITLFVWFLREVINLILNKDLEKFKADLEKEAIEFKIRYEKIHGERVEVLKKVYKKISRTYRSFHSAISPLQFEGEDEQQEKRKEAVKRVNDLVNYYEDNRIFFREDLAIEVDDLLHGFRDVWSKFQLSKISKSVGDHREALSQWGSAWNQMKEKVPAVKGKLEDKFRDILGIK